MKMPQHRTIFLIDDDPICNLITAKVIEMSSNFKIVGTTTQACSALGQLNQWATSFDSQFPSVIFLDIDMPIMNGWEFLNEFQKLPKLALEKCNVYILSSSIDPGDMQKSKTYACVREFISKPLTPEKLENIVTRAGCSYN